MSFPRAKIQRFNEIKACTPSPAKYNVSTQEKIKMGVMGKAGTYVKRSGSPSRSDTGSVHSTPCFQTPTVPSKKKKLLGLSFKSTKTVDAEELREKIVECNNKDLYISDLTEQVEEMTARITDLQKENARLQSEKDECEGALVALQKQQKEDMARQLRQIREEHENLRSHNLVDLAKLLTYIGKIQELYDITIEECKGELERERREAREKKEKMRRDHFEEVELLITQHEQEGATIEKKLEESEERVKLLEETLKDANLRSELQIKEKTEEMQLLDKRHREEKDEVGKKLEESEAKIRLLEENFKDVNVLTELQMKEKIQEIEVGWKLELMKKEKEHEAILKECQEISEYNIIQSELEKNEIKALLSEKEQSYEAVEIKREQLEEEVNNLKNEKHAYELSISTFRDTIEVLKRRLINSDRDVEQLKEELEKSEAKILQFEKKCIELSDQLQEAQNGKEELEMQYESTSKIMQSQVSAVEKNLLEKVDALSSESRKMLKDKELLDEVLQQYKDQQSTVAEAQEAIKLSNSLIDSMELKQSELEAELKVCMAKLEEEIEEGAEVRKKYIEKSGKYDELAQQFEQLLQELDRAKGRTQELEKLIGPYQEQLEAYHCELSLLSNEKSSIANQAKELGLKYAEILGHQNHKQKIKHVKDLKEKLSEFSQKNMELEAKNYKSNKLIEKLKKEIDDLRKPGKKLKIGEDKENMASPKCLKGTQSPGPLKDKN
ncbi:hyaluronan mediated motility receptor-like isoform X2 [Tenebrio molitor]|uniref:hyaluronan mediated motility receptor-like isoform X2 n=1 Tax=Tenebrio molitor TaxID=7067 RepID=UPI0036247B07